MCYLSFVCFVFSLVRRIICFWYKLYKLICALRNQKLRWNDARIDSVKHSKGVHCKGPVTIQERRRGEKELSMELQIYNVPCPTQRFLRVFNTFEYRHKRWSYIDSSSIMVYEVRNLISSNKHFFPLQFLVVIRLPQCADCHSEISIFFHYKSNWENSIVLNSSKL